MRDRVKTWAVILAAGESTRMKKQKLLLPFGHTTMIGKVVDECARSAVGGTVVVTGSGHERIEQALLDHDPVKVYNESYKKGMFTSVKKGIGALPQQAGSALVMLGDQPMITSEVIDKIVGCEKASARGILVPVFKGRRGHPVLIGRDYFGEILSMHDEENLKTFMERHRKETCEVEVEEEDILKDIDIREEYEKELNNIKKHG